jgi:PAS domain S-box-containing protein
MHSQELVLDKPCRSMADATPVMLWFSGPDARCTFFNKAWLDFRGRSLEQEAGDGWAEGVHPDDRERCIDTYLTAFHARQSFEMKYRLQRADGAFRWVVDKGSPWIGQNASFRGYVGSTVEIAELEPTEAVEGKSTASVLPQGEDQFRLLVESVENYGIFMLDPSGNIISWNAGAERIKGYKAEEIIGKHFSCFYTAEDVQQGKPVKELEIAKTEGRYEEEGWRVKKNGSKFWANVVITAVRDRAGTLTGFAKVTRDLTERKHVEDAFRASHDDLEHRVRDRTAELVRLNEELRTSEERFRLMIEGVKDHAIYTVNSEGIVTSWNDGAARIYGYTAEEIIGQHRNRFFTPEEVASGTPQHELNQATANGWFSEEAWRVHKDGSRFWANGTMAALRDAAGELRGFVKVVRDLTERKHAETELQKNVAALQLRDRAIRAVSQGILITDPHQPDNPIIYASQGFEKLTGYSAEEVIGRNCRILQGPKTDPAVGKQVREAIRAGQECSVEILNYRKDGTPFWNALFVTPVRDEQGQLVHFIGVQADVTERRKLEGQVRQSQKMEAFGQLAGGVAHDFNNLLTIISGYSEILLGLLPSNDPKRSSVKAISEAGERAAGLTRQLLSFSRQTVLEPQVLDLNTVVTEAEKMLRRMIGEDVQLTAVLDPNISRVKVDPHQMGQVLMNLAVNARDAMPQGGKLTIETRNVELDEAYINTHIEVQAGRYVLLTVSDTGSGMTSEVKARIFEPFFTTKGVGKGTGLGLSVVHGIVKQSNGQIGAYSELGVGTTFKIYLPAVEEEVATSSAPDPTQVGRGTETVLLVEDEDGVREIALLSLQTKGYMVLPAASGKEAMRMVNKFTGSIDILVTDVVMPEMSGRQLAEILRPRFPQMKVLYLSGYTDDAVVRHGILQAEVAFLQKPYTPMGLLRKVRQVLDERK